MSEHDKPTKKILVQFKNLESAGIFGIEAPDGYEVPWGFYDAKTLESLDKVEPERSRKVRNILRNLDLEEGFKDRGEVEIYLLAYDFFNPLTTENLAS